MTGPTAATNGSDNDNATPTGGANPNTADIATDMTTETNDVTTVTGSGTSVGGTSQASQSNVGFVVGVVIGCLLLVIVVVISVAVTVLLVVRRGQQGSMKVDPTTIGTQAYNNALYAEGERALF